MQKIRTIRFVIVALFTRAWIEMIGTMDGGVGQYVALFTRAWIEIYSYYTTIVV